MFQLKYIQNLVSIFEESDVTSLEVSSWGMRVKIVDSSRPREYVEIPKRMKADPRSVEGTVRHG